MVTAKTPIDTVALTKLVYGFSAADRAQFKKLGFAAWLKDQLDPGKPENQFVAKSLKAFGSLNLLPSEAHNTFPYSTGNYLVADETTLATFLRRYWSDRQVFEMLTEFFHDYLPSPRGVDDYNLAHYDATIRSNVLGTYPDMLLASSRTPAMLSSLNGNENERDHPNENYGRELLELFTVTTAYQYTQQDVVSAARVLTGIRYWSDNTSLQVDVNRHWNGPVALLGWSDANPGGSKNAVLATSESMIRYLALLPATAKAFSVRMARRFVSDVPPDSLVAQMADTYTKTQGNIPEVFTTMAMSKEFASSFRAKVKRPSEFVGSVIRGLGLSLNRDILPGDVSKKYFLDGNPVQPLWQLATMQGHSPFGWPFPNGYPDTAAPWITMAAQINRWNVAHQYAYGWGPDSLSQPDYAKLLPASANTSEKVIDAVSQLFLGAKLPADERVAALAMMKSVGYGEAPNRLRRQTQIAVGLVLSKPEWNLR
jgi:Protein of unknown function (DUF1800)